jgi:hypothetical protein
VKLAKQTQQTQQTNKTKQTKQTKKPCKGRIYVIGGKRRCVGEHITKHKNTKYTKHIKLHKA